MNAKKNIEIFESVEVLSEAVARFISDKAEKAIREKGRFTLVLAGGKTPELLFTLLSQALYERVIAWDKVFVFWGDERCVALNDEQNNAHRAKKLLLDRVNIPAANIYRIPSDLEPAKAARLYEDSIRHFFKGAKPSFDLILLGLGEDGHTASLFPHTDVLHDSSHLVTSLYLEEQKMYRITMTAPLINMAHNILFMVAGPAKAGIFHAVIDGPYEPEKYPAQMINPQSGGLYWYIEKGVAELLQKA